MRSDGAGHLLVSSQTYSMPFSGSALRDQGQPKRGRGREWEGGRKGETWGFCFLSVSGSNSGTTSSSQTAPLVDPRFSPPSHTRAGLSKSSCLQAVSGIWQYNLLPPSSHL